MLRYLWISALVLGLDQLSKWAAVHYLAPHAKAELLPFLNLRPVYNTGAAFGFLSDAPGWQNGLFIAVAVVVCTAIVFMLRRLARGEIFMALGFALIMGGALGNLADRLLRGRVVDFIDVFFRTWHFWTFNLADAAITVGAALLLFDLCVLGRRERGA